MIVVNGQLPRSLLMQIPKDIQQEIIRQQTQKPHRSPHNKSILLDDEQKYKENGHIESTSNNNDYLPASNGNGSPHSNHDHDNDKQQNGKHSPNNKTSCLPSLRKPKKKRNHRYYRALYQNPRNQ